MLHSRLYRAGVSITLIAFVLLPGTARAWGERGHHVVAYTAAKIVREHVPGTAKGLALAKFFSDRAIMMGHLSNVPDTSWKDYGAKRRISAMNSPNHYFGPERVLGAPSALEGEEFETFLRNVRSLPADYDEFKRRYQGTDNRLPGVPASSRRLNVYSGVGTTPWRAQQLYSNLVEAFRCAKGKESTSAAATLMAYESLPLPIRQPADGLGETAEPPLPSYVCDAAFPRKADLAAAQIIAGILAHFVGDQTQPYHPTADHDGWATGNGGIHVYFESLVVQEMGESLGLEVYDRARDAVYARGAWDKVSADLSAPNGAVQLLFNMAADAQSHKTALLRADDGHAIVRKSDQLAWGDHPSNHPRGMVRYAERKDPSAPEVRQAMRPIAVERLAAGAVVLARMWVEAWRAGGEPSLADMNAVSLPYPLDPPFIWPDWDPEFLRRTGRSSAEALLQAASSDTRPICAHP